MRTILLTLCLLTFGAPDNLLAQADSDGYHVMWTTEKGKAKCCNKKSKEKADQCAEKMRAKGKVKDVQVMAGKCKDM